MRAFLLILIIGSTTGLPPGSPDACVNSPCGPGALCETTSTLIVCKCPPNFVGDPFVACTPASGPVAEKLPPIAETTVTPTTSITYLPTKSNLPQEDSTRNTGSSSTFTTDYQVNTDYSRVPIRGSSSVPASLPTSVTPRPSHETNPPKYFSNDAMPKPTTNFMLNQPQQMNNDFRRPISQGSASSSSEGIRHGSYNNYEQQRFPSFPERPDSPANMFADDSVGQFSPFLNCRTNVNGIVVCADNSADDYGLSHGNRRPGNKYTSNGLLISNDVDEQSRPFSKHQQNSENNFQNNNNNNNYHNSQFIQQKESFSHKITENNNNNNNKHPIQQANGNSHTNFDSNNNNELCKSVCGINAVCRIVIGRPVCGCPEFHTGDPSARCVPIENEANKNSGCQRHTDCSATEICVQTQCVDPCSSSFQSTNQQSHNGGMCGQNAKCMVVEHTPLCGCSEGYYGNPYLACIA